MISSCCPYAPPPPTLPTPKSSSLELSFRIGSARTGDVKAAREGSQDLVPTDKCSD